MAKKNKKLDSNKVIEHLKKVAEENGYTLIFMKAEDKTINVVTYPFKPTICSQEDVARALANVMDEEGLFNDEQAFNQFKKFVEPKDVDTMNFCLSSDRNFRVDVFNNKNICGTRIVLNY